MSLKKMFISLTVLFIISSIVFGISIFFREYNYKVNIGQYISMADDASTPALKLDHLKQYREKVSAGIHRDSARYFLKQDRLTKSVQLSNLDSLIQRLEDLSSLTPDSLAYQQGLLQITGQEFDHTVGEIDAIFRDCYMRDKFFTRFGSGVFLFVSIIAAMLSFIAAMIADIYNK